MDSRTQDFVPPQTSGAQQPEAEAEAPRPSDKLKLAISAVRGSTNTERTKVVAELRRGGNRSPRDVA